MTLPIYVINLDRAPDRLAHMSAQMQQLGLDWQRIPAIDRQGADAAAMAANFGVGRATRLFPVALGDICCSLTHRAIWLHLCGSGAPAAIVLEDDAILSDAFGRLARVDLVSFMAEFGLGLLKLEFWPGPEKSRRFPTGEMLGPLPGRLGLSAYRMRSTFLGTCAYVITAEAARTVLGRFPAMQVPVDHYLFGASAGFGFDLIRPGFVNPAPVQHGVEEFGSDIRDGRNEAGILDAPRSYLRRLREYRLRRRLARETMQGEAETIEMRFAGPPILTREAG